MRKNRLQGYNVENQNNKDKLLIKNRLQIMTEDQIQAQIVIYFRNKYQMQKKALIHSTPNGGSRNVLEAKKLKATGLTPGVADLTIKLPNSRFIDVEVKIPTGKQSPNQIKIESFLKNINCNYIVVYSLEDFIETVEPLIDSYIL